MPLDPVPAEWTSPFAALPEFLYRPGCALQAFTVIMSGRYERGTDRFATTHPTPADSLVAALHSMTDRRALRVIEVEAGPSLFNERLFEEMAEGHLLPALTSLEMVWAEARQPPDTLIPMLCSRAGATMNTISSVVLGVRNGGGLQADVLDCMADLRQRGVRASLW